MNSDIFKYCSGPYGDRRIRSFTQDLDWRSEWDEIPQEHKNALVEWLNDGDIVKGNLLEISRLVSYGNPFAEYLMKEKKIPEPDIQEYKMNGYRSAGDAFRYEADQDTKDMMKFKTEGAGTLCTEYKDAKPFIEAFMSHKEQGHKLRKILHSKKLQIGFAIDEVSEEHMIKFASLQPIWSPPEEKTFEKDERAKMREKPQKSDEHLDKIFKTTIYHPWGLDWAGILKLNTSKVSTIMGGAQHAVPFARQRYRILWINLKTRSQQEITYESVDISKMIEAGEVFETEGHDKSPAIYPYDHHPECAMGPLHGSHERKRLRFKTPKKDQES